MAHGAGETAQFVDKSIIKSGSGCWKDISTSTMVLKS